MSYNTRDGQVEENGVTIKYWSEYPESGKVMYFKVNDGELKPVKGLRRNNKAGYYTCKAAGPREIIKAIVEAYK